MVSGTIATAISIALPILKLSRESIDKVNQKCTERGLPLAFEIKIPGDDNDITDFDIQGNQNYRFEGFGLVVGLPIKLSFWVHYKPDSTDHVEVGKILVPIRFSEVFDLPKILR